MKVFHWMNSEPESTKQHTPVASWLTGSVLIALGIAFLSRELGLPVQINWWALFLLLPAYPALAKVMRLYRKRKRKEMAHSLARVGVLSLLCLALLLDLDWQRIWPFFLILSGIVVIVSDRKSREPQL